MRDKEERGDESGAVAGGAELQESVCCMLMCMCVREPRDDEDGSGGCAAQL